MFDDVEGFILAGGQSSRMGRDKAGLRLGAETFVERIAHALAPVAVGGVKVIGARTPDVACGLPVVADVYQNKGALGGLHAALTHTTRRWIAVVACDLPFVTSELLTHLAALRQTFDAVVPVQRDERPQPLCAFYRREPCLAMAQKLIEAGELRPRVLLEKVNARRVMPLEWANISGAEHFFINVNTPQDFARATEKELHV